MQIRQGDVLLMLIETGEPDETLKPIAPEGGRVVLAHGEATGHSHSIDAASAAFFEGPAGRRYLRMLGPSSLEHQEHKPHLLPGGWYEVVRQQEYTPQAIRNVQD